MINKDEFLSLCNLTEDVFAKSQMEWSDLEKIAAEYEKTEPVLHDIGKDFVDDYLYDIEKAGIHSYRYRTKDVVYLLEKIIRKNVKIPKNLLIWTTPIFISI